MRSIAAGRAASSSTRTGCTRSHAGGREPGALCIFEYVYLARPDSDLDGVEVYGARVRMGEQLAREAPVDADMVMPIPDSGTPAAIGFARESGIPFGEGLIKNRYVGRTFIQPEQGMREQGIRMKFNPLTEVAGKRVVIVDDTIVRGNTTRQITSMLFDAGATEVHVRVSSPPIVSPCFYGIDFGDTEQLVAAGRSARGGARPASARPRWRTSRSTGCRRPSGGPSRRSAAPASRGATRRRRRSTARSPSTGSRLRRSPSRSGSDARRALLLEDAARLGDAAR